MFGWRQRPNKEDAAFQALAAENTDLRRALREERQAHTAEVQGLLDRIMALTAPGAVRELKRQPPSTSPEPVEPTTSSRPRIRYPGLSHISRPPLPATPPQVPGSSQLTPRQVEALFEKNSFDKEPA